MGKLEMLMGMLTVAWGRESFSRVVLMMNLQGRRSTWYKPLCENLPIFPKNEGGWYADLSLGGIVSHRDEQLVVVLVLVSDDHPHCPGCLGSDHFGHEGALAPLYESQPALHLAGVPDEAAATGRLGGHQLDPTVTHIPAGGKYCGVGLRYQKYSGLRDLSFYTSLPCKWRTTPLARWFQRKCSRSLKTGGILHRLMRGCGLSQKILPTQTSVKLRVERVCQLTDYSECSEGNPRHY